LYLYTKTLVFQFLFRFLLYNISVCGYCHIYQCARFLFFVFNNNNYYYCYYSLTLGRPKLEYASKVTEPYNVYWRQKLERIQRKFVVLYQNHFFTYDHVTYEDILKFL
jgi:hypothetical protein